MKFKTSFTLILLASLLAALLGLLVPVKVAHASGSGTWTTTGSMNAGRLDHTATLLPNGQVLVAGGSGGSGSFGVTSAELYDPSSGTWTFTGSMNAGRLFHTATLLPNGKVLIAGGCCDSLLNLLASAELYTTDTTPPVLQLPANMTVDATSPQGRTVTYTVTASDPDNAASQLTITCTDTSGKSYPTGTNVSATFPIGTTTVTCMASDPAGNTASGNFTVTVEGAAQQVSDLINTVNNMGLSSSLQNALDAKLQDVLTAINAGQTATACSELTDFIGFVQSHTGKGISSSQATTLIKAATNIQGVLGC